MSKLKAFLKETPTGKTEDVIISDRFIDDESGKIEPFVVKSISMERVNRLRESCKKKGELNNSLFTNKLIVECTVEPNFKDSEVCQYYGTMDPLEIPEKMLTPGEYRRLEEAIMGVNDLGEEYRERVEAAKNS